MNQNRKQSAAHQMHVHIAVLVHVPCLMPIGLAQVVQLPDLGAGERVPDHRGGQEVPGHALRKIFIEGNLWKVERRTAAQGHACGNKAPVDAQRMPFKALLGHEVRDQDRVEGNEIRTVGNGRDFTSLPAGGLKRDELRKEVLPRERAVQDLDRYRSPALKLLEVSFQVSARLPRDAR
jgi:hypothetical protein